MRKNSVRKWLHAVLDFLPLLVIPIFAIYTRNENYNSNIEIQVEENKVVDFNQVAFKSSDTNISVDNGVFTYIAPNNVTNNNVSLTLNYPYIKSHLMLLKADLLEVSGTSSSWYLNYNFNSPWSNNTLSASSNFVTEREVIVQRNDSNENCITRFMIYGTWSTGFTMKVRLQIFDLTKMYGVGNEPTIETFNATFSDTYYEPTYSHKETIPNYITTYNDTDVGSQFVYTLYNATDKYFNCTNLFNLEQVWNWVQLNLFGGNAPLMVYVVWQVIVYEFFMDLIFLLYSVFMFVIDFATNCIDRFTGRANRC